MPALLLAFLAAAPAPASTTLETALDDIRAEEICADVRFLAADELAGRDSPSPGLEVAANYLAARLERLGWTPGARQGWFHEYELELTSAVPEACSLVLEAGGEEIELRLGRDYAFSTWGLGDLEAAGEVVYCGGGDSEHLEAAELSGRWALVVPAQELGLRELYLLSRRARADGAVGVLVAPGPDLAGADALLAERAELAVRGVIPRGGSARRSSDFAFTHLSSAGAARLLSMGAGDTAFAPPAVGSALGVRARETRRVRDGVAPLRNVCGFWPGSDAELAGETIVVSAHYDHEGVKDGQVYNGADDNASGTSALLAVAEALARLGPQRRSVALLWVSAEEKGLLGSRAWTLDPWLPGGARVVANVNIDMVGRNAPDELMVTPSRSHPEHNELVRVAERLAPSEGFPALESCDEFWRRSDHMNFADNLDVPVAFLFAGVHDDYHEPTDDVEKIDCDKVRRAARLVVRLIAGLQGDTLGS